MAEPGNSFFLCSVTPGRLFAEAGVWDTGFLGMAMVPLAFPWMLGWGAGSGH